MKTAAQKKVQYPKRKGKTGLYKGWLPMRVLQNGSLDIHYVPPLRALLKMEGKFVVELKKGMTSDRVIGQTLRYIGWVRENLGNGKPVKGLIIAKEIDEKLRYSLPKDPEIRVKTYELGFKLRDA